MSERLSKTKKLLIDVARELFAKKGKESVTMNDIAKASNKGRRTIYTYFSNKDDVYKAVIKYELSLVIDALNENEKRNIDSFTKLKNHIFTHLDAVKNAVERNGTLRAVFFNSILEVERYRKKLDRTEQEIIKNILYNGIKNKEFKKIDIESISIIILYALKGLEIPYIKQNINENFYRNKNDIIEFIFKGLKENNQ